MSLRRRYLASIRAHRLTCGQMRKQLRALEPFRAGVSGLRKPELQEALARSACLTGHLYRPAGHPSIRAGWEWTAIMSRAEWLEVVLGWLGRDTAESWR